MRQFHCGKLKLAEQNCWLRDLVLFGCCFDQILPDNWFKKKKKKRVEHCCMCSALLCYTTTGELWGLHLTNTNSETPELNLIGYN